MTLPLAREFAPFGIRVMTIAPGVFGSHFFFDLHLHRF
jgi:NAD(P)-dependent dehydrogenase (short-subunit alcohol dehydrogenase family)